jgi:hypothetical protein
MKKIKDAVLEIVEIAQACPENLQQICFQTLLTHFLQGLKTPAAQGEREVKVEQKSKDEGDQAAKDVEKKEMVQEDLDESDLHLKAKKFLQKEGLTIEHLNNLFYKEGGDIQPLYDDLKTTRMSESQIRITLLQSLVHAIRTGEFEATVEAVRTECSQRKCYDRANFTATFKNNKTLFGFDKFDKTTKSVRLSDAGRKELSDLIKELQ